MKFLSICLMLYDDGTVKFNSPHFRYLSVLDIAAPHYRHRDCGGTRPVARLPLEIFPIATPVGSADPCEITAMKIGNIRSFRGKQYKR